MSERLTDVLTSTLVSTVLTCTFTFAIFLLNRRRQDRHWLRDQKLQAYVSLEVLLNEWSGIAERLPSMPQRLPDGFDDVYRRICLITSDREVLTSLLSVKALIENVQRAYHLMSHDEIEEHKSKMMQNIYRTLSLSRLI